MGAGQALLSATFGTDEFFKLELLQAEPTRALLRWVERMGRKMGFKNHF